MRSIRVGAGGIMLPNHAPLVIAEQFGTLEAIFPGRIDLAVLAGHPEHVACPIVVGGAAGDEQEIR
jgi:alkanesulfonate monooxygenase SsuD/methylene tetrahydromethanopterin reductase-like flavin-dependent oxidoreductase (luciferase family)